MSAPNAKNEVIAIKRQIPAILITCLLVTLMLPIVTLANGDTETNGSDGLDVTIGISGDSPNVEVDVDGKNATVGVFTGKKSEIIVGTGNKSNVYINGEDLDDLRPQIFVRKTTYDDDWMEEALANINYNMDILASALSSLMQDVENMDIGFANLISRLRAEIYSEMNRLHYGETTVHTVIGTEQYLVNSLFHKFDSFTSRRINEYTTVVALRMLEELGVRFLYDKVDGVGYITLLYSDKAIVLQIGSKNMLIMDSFGTAKIELNSEPQLYGDRIYLPTREVSQYLGFDVIWNNLDDSIIIKHLEPEYPDIEVFQEAFDNRFEDPEADDQENESEQTSDDTSEDTNDSDEDPDSTT